MHAMNTTRTGLRSRIPQFARLAAVAGLALGMSVSPGEYQFVSSVLAQPAPRPEDSVIAQRTAKGIANIALLDLQTTGTPDVPAFRMAARLLEAAHTISPRDEQILRLLIDALSEAGEGEKVLEYTRRLVELSPRDTVSLLRLISGGVSSLQDADARLAAYERLLGPKYEKTIDESIRSRLALDAALLLREQGDTDGFVAKLTLATTLDSTNKDAASLAATYFSMQSDDAVGRLTLLINLLKADPFDPETHLAIGRELSANGAFEQAKRFFLNYQLLSTRLSLRPTASEVAEFQTIAWMLDGPERLISQTRLQVEQERTRLAAERRAKLTEDPTATDLPDPDEYRLAMEVERVRAIAAAALGDEAQIDYVAQELEGTISRRAASLLDAAKRPADMTEEEATAEVKSIAAELMWMRLWIGRNLEGAVTTLESIEKDTGLNPESLARFQGWVRLRRGQLDGAAEVLSPLETSDPLAAIGMALIAEKKGEQSSAVERYTKVYHMYPGTLAGAYSKSRAEVLIGSAPVPPAGSKPVADLAGAVPGWLEGIIADSRRVFSLRASAVYPRIGPLDYAVVRLTILNLSPIPLGIGPDRPIQSSMLLAPRLTVAYRPIGVGNASNIARVDRRLRLLPQESVEVDVWADAGVLSFILDQTSIASAELRWNVLQGFSIDADGMYSAGPMNVSSETGVLTRAVSNKSGMDVASITNFITTGTADDVIESMLVLRYLAQATRDPNDEATKKADAKLAEAFANRFPTLSQIGKLGLIAKMPTPLLVPWLEPLVRAIRADEDPVVRLFAMVATTHEANDAFLATCAASGDARLAEVANVLKVRLENGDDTYSRLGAPEKPAEPAPNGTP